jgi:hypothetical protein
MHTGNAYDRVRDLDDGTSETVGLRAAGLLAFGGAAVSLVAGALHPGTQPPNQHAAVFAEYAASSTWTAVHLGQFVGMALLIAGLLGVLDALKSATPGRASGRLVRLGIVVASIALALYAMLQAVDGVALKQAVDAWASAPASERAGRFAAAETVRWLEWGARSYHSFVFGSALLLAGAALVWNRRSLRIAGVLMAGSGLTYLAQGWILGTEGFSDANTAPTLGGYVLVFGWTIALLVAARRGTEGTRATSSPVEPGKSTETPT